MKTKNKTLLSGLIFIAIGVQVFGQETLLFQHSGANNPTDEGFLLGSYGSPHLESVTNDLGMNAWSIQMLSSDAAQYSRTLTPQQTAAIAGANWVLSLNLRILQAPTTPSYDISVTFGTSTVLYSLYFGEKANGDPVLQVGGANLSGSSLSPVFALNGAGSTYNNYQLIYNATANTASLWVNGTDMIDDIMGGQLSGNAHLSWSGYQHDNDVQANWNLVSLSVPEPSAISFVLLGSGVLIYARRKYKKP